MVEVEFFEIFTAMVKAATIAGGHMLRRGAKHSTTLNHLFTKSGKMYHNHISRTQDPKLPEMLSDDETLAKGCNLYSGFIITGGMTLVQQKRNLEKSKRIDVLEERVTAIEKSPKGITKKRIDALEERVTALEKSLKVFL
ncbi:hypothetical protein P3L10_025058 [Capsicum annuum]|uniref:uncharacterized protein LOC107840607 n=1 Tax=Capsicum annuum TaxID=4072 RepID=UPI001FB19E62|nr:uncharacterized protein LOC107840607 [Capsicum annuum]XP_047251205.1 uncharacterized protein LOC107840607 [Capsicum annuum]